MSVSKAEHDELCCVYASLLLADENLEITADKINKIVGASGNQVDGYYPEFFARYFSNVNLNTLLTSIGSAGVPAAGQTAAATSAPAKEDKAKGGKDDKKAAPAKVEKKEEPPAEEDAGGFGDLFG